METDGLLVLMGLAIRDVLLRLIWLRVLVVGDFPTLEREEAKLLALKELPDVLAPELVEVEGRDTIDRLDVLMLDEPLRVTLELLLIEGLDELTLELLLVEGL